MLAKCTSLHKSNWRLIENSVLAPRNDALASFAVDDTLCQVIGQGKSAPTVRSWVHEKTVVLGIQDGRLPNLRAGVHFLKENGWHVIIRNSGGLAVVIDEGVINLSLIVNEKQLKLSIEKGYEMMVTLLRALLAPFGISFVTGEIIGSYCSGNYDLSMNGKKFAGISQRRIRGGATIQVYLCVTGSGQERAKLIRTFYELASEGRAHHYPLIQPATMASLNELAPKTMSLIEVKNELYELLTRHVHVIDSDLSEEEVQLFNRHYELVLARNEKAGLSSMQ